jgi:hypothetical protein
MKALTIDRAFQCLDLRFRRCVRKAAVETPGHKIDHSVAAHAITIARVIDGTSQETVARCRLIAELGAGLYTLEVYYQRGKKLNG